MTIRTNPAYLHLARQRAILRHTANWLLREFVGLKGDPKGTIICDEVFHVDREIPSETIMEFVEELQRKEQDVRLEMSKFDFRKQDEDAKNTKQLPAKKVAAKKKSRGGRRKATR
jgi:hypothetical protein